MNQQKNLAILVSGGPAPGINSVISSATIRARLEAEMAAEKKSEDELRAHLAKLKAHDELQKKS